MVYVQLVLFQCGLLFQFVQLFQLVNVGAHEAELFISIGKFRVVIQKVWILVVSVEEHPLAEMVAKVEASAQLFKKLNYII